MTALTEAVAQRTVNPPFAGGQAQRRAGLMLAGPAALLLAALLIGPSSIVLLLSFTDASLGHPGSQSLLKGTGVTDF